MISALSALALLGITAYLVFGAVKSYRGYKAVSKLSDQFYSGEVQPDELDSQIATLRRYLDNSPNPQFKLLLFDMLLFKAWYYPDESSDTLKEALKTGNDLYRTLGMGHGPIGAQLAFGYLYAGLPGKLPSWKVEVAAQSPQYRPQLDLLEFYGRVMSDDLAGAQQLIDDEVESYGKIPDMKAMAASAYDAMGLEHEAAQMALDEKQREGLYGNLLDSYAVYLLDTGDYAAAEKLLRESLKDLPSDPDRSFELAVCLTILRGVDDPEVQSLLDTAAKSTRDPSSVDGERALCLANAYTLEGDTVLAEQLLAMAGEDPADYHVLYGLTSLALKLAKDGVDPSQTLPDGAAQSPLIADPVSLAQQTLAAAGSPGQKQDAQLQLALALAYSAKGLDAPQTVLNDAADHFATALGSGDGHDATATDRIPDYDSFLLDPVLIDLRKSDPDFDLQIHRAVVDLLNRRSEMFKEVVALPKVEHTN